MQGVIQVEGLKELRKALRDAEDATPRELTRALKVAGEPVPPAILARVPVSTGALRDSIGKAQASGTKAKVPIKASYAAIAEFSNKGRYGQTMTQRYGPTPRYGYRGLDDVADQVVERLDREMKDIITAKGWMR